MDSCLSASDQTPLAREAGDSFRRASAGIRAGLLFVSRAIRAPMAHRPQPIPRLMSFDNDFAALLPDSGVKAEASDPLFRAEPESGVCRVICYNPRHDLSMSLMTPEQVEPVIDVWQSEFAALGGRPDIGYVQIFENRGLIMGCSNPHPHGQVWATRSVPDLPAREDICQKDWLRTQGECLLCAYVRKEVEKGERLVLQNESFVALVPYWAVWPFETLVLPKKHASSILEMSAREKRDLASLLVGLTVRYDNLFLTSFPYSMGIHQAPSTGENSEHWHWHMHFFPAIAAFQYSEKIHGGI